MRSGVLLVRSCVGRLGGGELLHIDCSSQAKRLMGMEDTQQVGAFPAGSIVICRSNS